ncbi:uncharacterized protein LOC126975559 isoform X2 [Leptidea sinapis]|uniref:uncharacterized protein LOC126975559 isoform X2 n=1 Tax=Leptidea sinapis TaxID=189913 RepID=UPI0021C432B0|nr:uncharacterized protein LOC126975559 isoform X2 [Leptidea sinapis]
MDKENRSAAGLRRSAIAERLRLREEWSALKGVEEKKAVEARVLTKRQQNVFKPKTVNKNRDMKRYNLRKDLPNSTSDVLRGVVALVDVGAESRALALRAALTALGASVVPIWSPLVTHVIWTQGGCRETRAKGRALACQLVSPLWVEACASAARRLPERLFPAPTRPSDLPSPATLRHLLRKAEQENISLENLLSESDEALPRLRISSENERDTSADQSHDKSHTSNDSPDRSRPDLITQRQPHLLTGATSPHKKSKRKLFTQKETDLITDEDDDGSPSPAKQKRPQGVVSGRERRGLVRAERLARKLVETPCARDKRRIATTSDRVPRIVLTGMSRMERHEVCNAIRSLGGRIQSRVNKRTTHVVLGSCRESSPERALAQMFSNINMDQVDKPVDDRTNNNKQLNDDKENNRNRCGDISGVNVLNETSQSDRVIVCSSVDNVVMNKPRNVNALLGAVRGCRVLWTSWLLESAKQGRWLPHYGHEVHHLLKVSQRARVERCALGRTRSEYACDVFCGLRVRVDQAATNRDDVITLLTLCGATLDVREGMVEGTQAEAMVTVGAAVGQVSSRWVFDSVVAGRPRTTRRYLHKQVPLDVVHLTRGSE